MATHPGEAGKMEPRLLPPDVVTAGHWCQPSRLAGTAREDLLLDHIGLCILCSQDMAGTHLAPEESADSAAL